MGNGTEWIVDRGDGQGPQPAAVRPPELQVMERQRVYVYPSGKLRIPDVMTVTPHKDGTHRLVTRDGRKVIAAAGWLGIELDADQFPA